MRTRQGGCVTETRKPIRRTGTEGRKKQTTYQEPRKETSFDSNQVGIGPEGNKSFGGI